MESFKRVARIAAGGFALATVWEWRDLQRIPDAIADQKRADYYSVRTEGSASSMRGQVLILRVPQDRVRCAYRRAF